MIEELQLLNHIINEKDVSVLRKYNITDDYFIAHRDVLEFVRSYKKEYSGYPSMDLILSKFEDFDKVEVDNLEYVTSQLKQQQMARAMKPVFEKSIELYNAARVNEAVDYFQKESKKLRDILGSSVQYHDWVSDAERRFNKFKEMAETPDDLKGIPTGFPAVDSIFNGGLKNGDLAIVFARLKNGKSWIAQHILTSAFKKGHNVALFSLEMDEYQTGYRLDTLYGKFSNRGLSTGDIQRVPMDAYSQYIGELKKKDRFFHILTNEQNGRRKWTPSDIRDYIEEADPDVVCIDQLSLMGWGGRFKSKTEAYGYLSDQCKTIAMDYGKPVILLAQAGRQVMNKIREDKNAMPDNEDVQYSDALMQYADKGLSIRKISDVVKMKITANRGGDEGDELMYRWYFDSGIVEELDDTTVNF